MTGEGRAGAWVVAQNVSEARPRGMHRGTLWAFAWSMAACVAMGKAVAVLPWLGADFGLRLIPAGWTVGIFFLPTVLLGAWMGAQAAGPAGLARRIAMSAGLLVLGALLGAVATTPSMVMTGRLMEGLGYLLAMTGAPQLIHRTIAPEDRPRAFAVWRLSFPLGIALVLASAPLAPLLGGWRGLWLAWGVLPAVLGLVLLVRLPPATGAVPLPPLPPHHCLRAVFGRLPLWLLALAIGGYAVQWFALVTWMSTGLAVGWGLAPQWGTLLAAGVALATAPGNWMGGWFLSHGLPASRLITAASLCMGLSGPIVVYGLVPDVERYLLCLVFALTGGMLPSAVLAAVRGRIPKDGHLPAATGLILQGASLGLMLAPPGAAALVLATGGAWSAMAHAMLGGAVLAGVAGLLLGRMRAPLCSEAERLRQPENQCRDGDQ